LLYVHTNLIRAATFLEIYLARNILVTTRNELSVTMTKHVFNNLTALERKEQKKRKTKKKSTSQ
jgi:hypothetical protein